MPLTKALIPFQVSVASGKIWFGGKSKIEFITKFN